MGFQEAEAGRVVFSVEPAEYHYNPIGMVHGGLAATLCDSAMGCAIHSTLSAGVGYTTLELKVNFVRPLTVATGLVLCEGKVINVGSRVGTAEARVTGCCHHGRQSASHRTAPRAACAAVACADDRHMRAARHSGLA